LIFRVVPFEWNKSQLSAFALDSGDIHASETIRGSAAADFAAMLQVRASASILDHHQRPANRPQISYVLMRVRQSELDF
jgi:hypothetical protein